MGAYIFERVSGVLAGNIIDEHVRPWSNNSGVDETKEEKASDECANSLILSIRILAPRQTPNLLAYPPDTVGCLLKACNDCVKERVGNFNQHGYPGRDDLLDRLVLCSLLRCDAPGKI